MEDSKGLGSHIEASGVVAEEVNVREVKCKTEGLRERVLAGLEDREELGTHIKV